MDFGCFLQSGLLLVPSPNSTIKLIIFHISGGVCTALFRHFQISSRVFDIIGLFFCILYFFLKYGV